MCCEWLDPYIKKCLDLVHFITLYESPEHEVIRQNEKLGYIFLSKMFLLLPSILNILFQTEQNILHEPPGTRFSFQQKGKSILHTRMKKNDPK